MSRDANLGFDNHYNRRLQDIISQMDNMDVINNTQPMLFGGGPLRSHIVPSGNLGHYAPIELLAEASAMGNSGGRKFNVTKFLRPTMRALNSKQGQSIIKPITAALTARAVKTIEGGEMSGGINRYKKATKWLGFTTKALSSGLDLAARAKTLSGRGLEEDARKVVRVAKRVAKDPLVRELVSVARKAPIVRQAVAKAKKIVGGGRGARAEIVKQVMREHGIGMIAASKFVKANGLY